MTGFDISENISNILKMFLGLIIKVMILDVDLILVEVIYRNFHSVTNRILLSGEYEKEGIKNKMLQVKWFRHRTIDLFERNASSLKKKKPKCYYTLHLERKFEVDKLNTRNIKGILHKDNSTQFLNSRIQSLSSIRLD
ncbi:hypothetical protein APICC_06389 [Apis cerana cerana]|uniref:Uncharacterized protein n=1 Tax=Apis cerana cerana TaxID=94128 RepID=A0A2A3EFR3_APICC|nr:hypothetical protein APICC_06389 [Apis cerana cerana]